MASMSYCMFENTESEMSQVVSNMTESNTWEDLDLNSYEDASKESLYVLCKRYIKEFERLNSASNSDV
jgi:hypothetical protein